MKKLNVAIWPAAALLGLASLSAQAVPSLYEYQVNVDNVVYYPSFGDPLPANVDVSQFDDITGLGTITTQITGAGAHNFDAFFDIDVDVFGWAWETGSTSGVAAAGQSWEIDDPDFGDIRLVNFPASALDDTNDAIFPTNVSMAMGWDFTLAADEIADITMLLTEIMPTSGFYLAQYDEFNTDAVYLASSLNVRNEVPEPSMLLLMSAGFVGMIGARRKMAV